jgi:hypothetical protein
MNVSNFAVRLAAAAALSCAVSAAHATFTFGTTTGPGAAAAFSAGVVAPLASGTDTYSDLTINSDLATASLDRSAGPFGYTVTTETGLWTSQSPGNGGPPVTVQNASDTLTIGNFGWSTFNLGARLYLSDASSGSVVNGTMTVTATDILGGITTQTFSQSAIGSGLAGASEPNLFFQLGSTVALATVKLSGLVTATGNPTPIGYATVDNLVLQAVPLPSTWLMMLGGGAALLRLSSRRRG